LGSKSTGTYRKPKGDFGWCPALITARAEARREGRRPLWARPPAAADGADIGDAWGFLVLSVTVASLHTAALSERLARKR